MLLNAWGTGLGAGLGAGGRALAGRTCLTVLQSLRRPPPLLWHAADRRPLHASASSDAAAAGSSVAHGSVPQQERQQHVGPAPAAGAGEGNPAAEVPPQCSTTTAVGQVGPRGWVCVCVCVWAACVCGLCVGWYGGNVGWCDCIKLLRWPGCCVGGDAAAFAAATAQVAHVSAAGHGSPGQLCARTS